MNKVNLSSCERFVELWHNGAKIYSVPIAGSVHDSVSKAREYCRKWSGHDPEISKELRQRMKSIDSLVSCMAFAGEWK